MEVKQSIIGPIIRISLVMMLLCGLVYPLVVTGIAQVVMPEKADGSLLYNEDNEVIGSRLIGQNFTGSKYFHGRVSSIKNDGASSGSNNYAPSNKEMVKRIEASIAAWEKENPNIPIHHVPIDLVTNSGSGLDPHISPEAAYAQIDRISKATNLSTNELKELVEKHTEGKELGLLGEERINVLLLNLDLDKRIK
ncbi:potassium-transporting ATPase subunit KdpC [Niallia sp. 03091]|uniref:potassium-transporting ATPase subunit KdpC n=1 Tax=unclassified Niallia TaxID=2837522 RepID=UPI004044303A